VSGRDTLRKPFQKGQDISVKFLFCILLPLILLCSASGKNTVDIRSCVLRDRVVVLDRVLLKKSLFIAFSVSGTAQVQGDLRAEGGLFHEGKNVARSFTRLQGEQNGNLVFDLPDAMPEGTYTIRIDIKDDQRQYSAQGIRTIQRSELKNFIGENGNVAVPVLREAPEDAGPISVTDADRASGYIVFSRSTLVYEFSNRKPKQTEIITALSMTVVRNASASVSISLYPLQNLGTVRLEVDDIKGNREQASTIHPAISTIENVESTVGTPSGEFKNLPTLIRPGNRTTGVQGGSRRFWLTIRVEADAQPGFYTGVVRIIPQHGQVRKIPLQVLVEPITLGDIPGKDYFMLMTYEFTELVMSWNKKERKAIARSASNILKDYKNHGMTTLAIHSPFVLITREDGTPVLDDIFAALIAARDHGFTRPVIWYIGHLIQTAKPKHPGNITGFEEEAAVARLRYLVKTVSEFAAKNHCPPVIFLPIDEPDDSSQDYRDKRRAITPLLLKTIKESGGMTMLTSGHYEQWKPVEYVCSSEPDIQQLQAAHRDGSVYWLYNNEITTRCENPAYARYVYGHFTWKSNIDGMSSWTFQNTQNASGLPTKADRAGRDIYLTYPDPHGPLATLKWEAVREGIDDHKLIYQLMKRTAELKKHGIDTARYDAYLSGLKEKKGEPGCQGSEQSGWDPAFFERTRQELISLILDADKQQHSAKNNIH
jgi:hypothetical protein